MHPAAEGKPYRKTVASILNTIKPLTILDVACGGGWLKSRLDYQATLHGIDYYAPPPKGYDFFMNTDFNQGIHEDLGKYDAVVFCEAMSYIQNPGLFLSSVRKHIKANGIIIITDPNPIYAGARLNQLVQGFPRGCSHFVQNATPEPHMPWVSLGLFQYWLLLGLHGFKEITVHEVFEKKPKHIWEIPIGLLAKAYCKSRFKKSKTDNERRLWTQAMSDQIIYGRRLVISAVAA